MKDYSQGREQAVILSYFTAGPAIMTRGTVLDVGANDGITFSNSRALIELGWRGVLVEPADIAYKKLCINSDVLVSREHPSIPGDAMDFAIKIAGGKNIGMDGRVQCVNAAITTTDAPIDFWSSGTHLKKGDTDLLSTTQESELARWKRSGEQFTKTTVRGITFETLMRETGVRHYDFISIDAEGADFSILSQIDLTAVGCRLLCVEVNQRGDAEFTEYCARHGMRLLWKSAENRIYCR